MAPILVTQKQAPSTRTLRASLDGLLPGAPIVIMLHGFKYDPRIVSRNPARHIFALHPDSTSKRAVSWPRVLGLRGTRGLAIGYGWHATGTIWQAHANAEAAAAPLAGLITRLNAIAPGHPVHIVAHSLGARVALAALRQLGCDQVHRAILIAAAAFERELTATLNAPACRTTEIINIRSKANTLFDLMLRAALPHWGVTVGRGRLQHPRLLDINIDDPIHRTGLASLGFALTAKRRSVCHWSGYLRTDVQTLYRALLHRPAGTPFALMRTALTAQTRLRFTEHLASHLSFRQQLR